MSENSKFDPDAGPVAIQESVSGWTFTNCVFEPHVPPMVERVAKAMQQRAKEPLGNIESLEPVLVGSLGDAWRCLARAAIEAMREPTPEMVQAVRDHVHEIGAGDHGEAWGFMISAALK